MIRSKTPTRAASSVDPFAVELAAVDWIRERERCASEFRKGALGRRRLEHTFEAATC